MTKVDDPASSTADLVAAAAAETDEPARPAVAPVVPPTTLGEYLRVAFVRMKAGETRRAARWSAACS